MIIFRHLQTSTDGLMLQNQYVECKCYPLRKAPEGAPGMNGLEHRDYRDCVILFHQAHGIDMPHCAYRPLMDVSIAALCYAAQLLYPPRFSQLALPP